MDAVLRGASIYLVLLILFRIAGRRTLSEVTTFDFVLLLIIGEATQQALLGEDFSLTNAFLVISTLLAMDVALSIFKQQSVFLDRIIDGVPMVIVVDGRPLRDRIRRAQIDERDVMEAARRLRGLERMDQIRLAVLEVSGGITVIPKSP